MTSETMTAGRIASALLRRFPSAWAEEWDRVGLVAGDPDTPVSAVLVTLDATAEAVVRAAAAGAQLLLTHHPPYLEPPVTVRRMPGPAGTVEAALRTGVCVVSLHTNLDRSPDGADALPAALGLSIESPLEAGLERAALVTVFAPPDHEEPIRLAMTVAGAGALGEYDGCAFSAPGRGHFSPRVSASPYSATTAEGVAEVRIEMVAPPPLAAAVAEAARLAHPYEEPLVLVAEVSRARTNARMGRLCSWRAGATLSDLATAVTERLGVSVRVHGDPERTVDRVAVAGGSAGSLVTRAAEVADVLVAGEVRYHDALEASARELAVIEAGHDVTEWPLVGVLAGAVAELAPGVEVVRESAHPSWWTTEGAR